MPEQCGGEKDRARGVNEAPTENEANFVLLWNQRLSWQGPARPPVGRYPKPSGVGKRALVGAGRLLSLPKSKTNLYLGELPGEDASGLQWEKQQRMKKKGEIK